MLLPSAYVDNKIRKSLDDCFFASKIREIDTHVVFRHDVIELHLFRPSFSRQYTTDANSEKSTNSDEGPTLPGPTAHLASEITNTSYFFMIS